MSRHRGGTVFGRLLSVATVAALGALALTGLRVGGTPTLKLAASRPGIGPRTPVSLEAEEPRRGLVRLRLELLQGGRAFVLAEKSYAPRAAWAFWGALTARDEVRVEVGRDTLPELRSGLATLRATAVRAGTWLRPPAETVREITLPVRLEPPAIEVLSSQHRVRQGGAEAVVYRVGEGAVRDGVQAGERFFPGFPRPGGDSRERFALFAVPYDLTDVSRVALVAEDDLGNLGRRPFIERLARRPVNAERLELSRDFMARVVPEIQAHTPGLRSTGDLLADYLAINRDLRRRNTQELDQLSAKSAPRWLWRDAFLVLRGSQVMSSFADRRTYVFEGREVDRQDHLGFDMASTQRAAVAAANSGVVVLARYFGIFGNAVVIDHGYGLMTLYAHLSAIGVPEGQAVARGQIVGHTGRTGLAGGDHLHFSVLLHGLPVDPTEWWDAHWIHDRLQLKLGPAMSQPEAAARTGAS